MRKTLLLYVLLAVCTIISISMVSCSSVGAGPNGTIVNKPVPEPQNLEVIEKYNMKCNDVRISLVLIKEHHYILTQNNGVSMIHAESCPCLYKLEFEEKQ